MFYNILDKKRLVILPLLNNLKDDFYLAGGTALALQIGHRDSVDFDFFTKDDIATQNLFDDLKNIFQDKSIIKIQDEKNTLTVLIDTDIKLSFFTYRYPLLHDLIKEEYLNLASIDDIACMKLSAIVSRSTMKDYIDLYFILQDMDLSTLLDKCSQKFPSLDTNLILKSLLYFEDIIDEPIIFKNQNNVSLEEIQKFFKILIKKLN